jgi:polyhydroxybutyrate depolymerase
MSRTPRMVLAVAVIACMGVAIGCGTSVTRAQSSGAQKEVAPAPSTVSAVQTALTGVRSIVSGGVTRIYVLHRPANLPAGKVALMIALHPARSTGQAMESLTGFDALADIKGFIVAYPDAQTNRPVALNDGLWDLGCCDAERSSPDDVNFIGDLIKHLVATANVAPDRVYVTGFSWGADLAYRLACKLPSQVAGVGSVGGSEILSTPCSTHQPVTIYEVHGTQDYYGGSCGGTTQTDHGCAFGHRGYEPSVMEVNAQWRGLDGCPATPATQVFGSITEKTWHPCRGGSAVRLDTIRDGTHCWPTTTTCGNLDASSAFWTFLSAHPRARRG